MTACTPGANAPSLPAVGIAPTATPHGSSPTATPGTTATPAATPTPVAPVPTPTPTPPVTPGVTTTSFVIALNGGGETILSKTRHPQFVSPSTQSITFSVDGGATTAQNLSASATNCAVRKRRRTLHGTARKRCGRRAHTRVDHVGRHERYRQQTRRKFKHRFHRRSESRQHSLRRHRRHRHQHRRRADRLRRERIDDPRIYPCIHRSTSTV